jgi:hypothetical protein
LADWPTPRLFPGFSIAGIVFTEDNLDIMVQPVFHLDMDAFCASVEVPGNPKPAANIKDLLEFCKRNQPGKQNQD